ncbi:SRPBCC family protein [Bythopirellula polymerisocia]|uniref:Polyketide cyclase / dehydrase and lipid transport n=1 Tax=Bythopirellula polymerisocia TaxID=2528003 RepID=A0A5C6CSF4_9BACT|nr:SRPBCC family protein [Bythopirellula polymerisocia]TWU27480.1 Polyketide cyclase / dehydrase and lipid transport [Bythopirellula polymerisocia]
MACEVRLPAAQNQVFDFFSDAFQLERLTPSWLNFSVLTPPPIDMHVGTLIDYRLRMHGIPLKWQSRIDCWDPPLQFSDVQMRGPYRFWEHLHTFEEDGDGTICRDEVHYNVFGGGLVHKLIVKPDLTKIFTYRTKVLQDIFANGTIPAAAELVSH